MGAMTIEDYSDAKRQLYVALRILEIRYAILQLEMAYALASFRHRLRFERTIRREIKNAFKRIKELENEL